MMYARPELLAEPEWLLEHLEDPAVRIVDCARLEAYRRAHIPGAVGLPVHYYIKEPPPPGEELGTFVMPPDQFAQLMGSLGIDNETLVVAYDDNNSLLAARLWWVLKYYGHTKAKVLNGGWHRWLTEGRHLTFHASRPAPKTFVARPNPDVIADAAFLLAHYADPAWCVLDVRSDEEWDGRNDRGNKRRGHVPGARHLEWIRFVSHDDRRMFLSAEELRRLLEEAGVPPIVPVVTYCQGGIRAAHAAFVLELLGYSHVRVYDGSMRDWANRDDTPLEL